MGEESGGTTLRRDSVESVRPSRWGTYERTRMLRAGPRPQHGRRFPLEGNRDGRGKSQARIPFKKPRHPGGILSTRIVRESGTASLDEWGEQSATLKKPSQISFRVVRGPGSVIVGGWAQKIGSEDDRSADEPPGECPLGREGGHERGAAHRDPGGLLQISSTRGTGLKGRAQWAAELSAGGDEGPSLFSDVDPIEQEEPPSYNR